MLFYNNQCFTGTSLKEVLMQRDVQLGSNPLQAAVDGATFIANHFRQKTEDDDVNLKHTQM
jgi:hypothetical protein